MRIGIPVIGSRGWQGGVVYVHNLLRALHGSHPGQFQAFLLADDRSIAWVPDHAEILNEGLLHGLIHVGQNTVTASAGFPCASVPTWELAFPLVDVVFPAGWGPRYERNYVCWIPDFQYHHLPQFSPPSELEFRYRQDSVIAGTARRVVFSSEDAHRDFRTLFPESRAETHVVHFHSSMPASVFQPSARAVADRYGCASNYLMCSNQFWTHKNHRTAFQAMRLLAQRGTPMQLVCTGSTSDYRNADYYRGLQDELAAWGGQEHVRLLGLIPRDDQVQLLRQARAIVQPSLFEGWSTVVEDGRSLGCPMFLSDIGVHREQDPPHARFFPPQDPAALADLIAAQAMTLPPPGAAREQAGRQHTAGRVREFGARVFSILSETARATTVSTGGAATVSLAAQAPASEAVPVIGTSLGMENLQNQRRCVDSWLALGFSVVSVNRDADVAALWKHFPGVRFHVVTRDARQTLRRPLIHLDDILAVMSGETSRSVGIVPSDLALVGGPGTAAALGRLAQDAVVYTQRIDVDGAGEIAGTRALFGCDALFMPRALTRSYPPTPLCLGTPWWDLWLALLPALQQIRLIRWEGPLGYRVRADAGWSSDIDRALGSLIRHHHERLTGVTPPRPPNPIMTPDENRLYLLHVLTTLNARTRSYFPEAAAPVSASAAIRAA